MENESKDQTEVKLAKKGKEMRQLTAQFLTASFKEPTTEKGKGADLHPLEKDTLHGRKPSLDPTAKALIRSIDTTLKSIQQIKDYQRVSRQQKRKENAIRDSIKNNILPTKSPAKKELAQLSETLRAYLKGKNKQQALQTRRELELIEFKLKNNIASKADLKKIGERALDSAEQMKQEKHQAIKMKEFEKRIHKVTQSYRASKLEKMQKPLRDTLDTIEKLEHKTAQSAQQSLAKRKMLIHAGQPPQNINDKAITKLLDFLTVQQTLKYRHPNEIQGKVNRPVDQVPQQAQQKSTWLLDRAKTALKRDQLTNDYENRTPERRALIDQIVKFSVSTQNEMKRKMALNPSKSLSKDYHTLDKFIAQVNKNRKVSNYRSMIKDQLMKRVNSLHFDKKKKTQSKKMGNH